MGPINTLMGRMEENQKGVFYTGSPPVTPGSILVIVAW
jgi:hypothetical protein